ncbi:hypothetical protein CH376_09880 [Leptospira adleri]|uniref:Uncharacterized protein n=1 Tax=Leptospira adleri TaxID=2023186 RepID=A0ABX4P3X7_9LEPT|nr:hypothetical protein CH376_09880 [Leptospira adleri]
MEFQQRFVETTFRWSSNIALSKQHFDGVPTTLCPNNISMEFRPFARFCSNYNKGSLFFYLKSDLKSETKILGEIRLYKIE